MSEERTFRLNGAQVVHHGDPMARLLDVLREDCGLKGTKEGCGEGECGACAVLIDGAVVCSCLVPVLQVEGCEVLTIEGVGSEHDLDALQEILVREGGVQCGACTPGVVITLRALLERDPAPDRTAVREALAGNLCRCTGYEAILRAGETLVAGEAGE